MLLPHRNHKRSREKRSFVLVLVLVMLVLISILVFGFLGHVTSQSKSSTSYRDQTGTLVLGDVAINVVKSQIDAATATAAASSGALWASQPGAIRTVSSTGAQTTYKLYSSSALTDSNTGASLKTDILGDLPPTADASDWSGSALWTDLNAPALRSDGITNAYPIVDVVNDPGDLPIGSTTTGPFASGSFNIDSKIGNNPIGATRGGGTFPLPMPVRWLYVLKQGQVIAPDNTSTATQLTFNKAPTVPTAANPIIGRIAFWTDDDTCRVNVNTAGFGTFWDTPRFTSSDDSNLASCQPLHNEFQRYPGHAATTTLALALPELTNYPEAIYGLSPRYYPGGSTEGTVPTYTSSQTELGSTPKTNRLYASVDELLFDPPTTNSSGVRSPSTNFGTGFSGAAAMLKAKNQVETAKFFLTAHSRAPELNLFGEPRVAIWPISSQTNTVTGSYRTATDQLIAFCATLPSSLSTPSTNTYYFTRAPHTGLVNGETAVGLTGSNSSTTDVDIARNVSLLTYLDSLTSVKLPGNLSGTSSYDSSTKYTQLGMRQILTEIFDYIRITNSRDPLLDPVQGKAYPPANTVSANVLYAATNAIANGNNDFADGQILPTEILPTNAAPNLNWGTYGYGRFSGRLVEATMIFVGVGKGATNSATPLVYGYPLGGTTTNSNSNCNPVPQAQCATTYNTSYNAASPPYYNSLYPTNNSSSIPSRTFANYPYNTYLTALPISTNSVTPAGHAPIGGVPPQNDTAVQAVFALSFFDPALGFAQSVPEFTVTVSGLNSLTLNGNSMDFPSMCTFLAQNPGFDGEPQHSGSSLTFQNFLTGWLGTGNAFGNTPYYQAFSNILNVPSTGSNPMMTLGGGGNVTVTVYPLRTQYLPDSPVHTYTLNLADICSSSLPVPGLSTRPLFGSIGVFGVRPPSSRLTVWPPNAPGWSGSTPPAGVQPYPDRFDSGSFDTPTDSNGERLNNIIDSFNDTVISMVPSSATYGDYRMLAATNTPSSAFVAHPNYSSLSSTGRLAYGAEYAGGGRGRGSSQGNLISGAVYYTGAPNGVNPGPTSAIPLVPATVAGATAGSSTAPPDFDNGFGPVPDGPYINKPDEGFVYLQSAAATPYFNNVNLGLQTNYESFFSPERQVPSPVMFGSLPTGAPVNGSTPKPWQTLLFQPGATGHAGLNPPKDEYLLDLFWMPEGEPYAISEPFSTAGKVNLNYQIFPFLYIDRSTAIQSVLASEKVAVAGTSAGNNPNQAATYKDANSISGTLRYPLNLSELNGTLSQFVQRFNNLDFFHTSAEICDVYLVPQGYSWSTDGGTSAPYTDSTAQSAFYNASIASANFNLVGDNTREKPYADIYSRITTKSNSFTVYYRVQTLKNPPAANAASWTEGQGAVLGDYRGSTTLERYIDPNDTTIPDYTANTGAANLETHYKWRVVENTRFSP